LKVKLLERREQKKLNKSIVTASQSEVSEEIIAVLTTVLEIEMRIRFSFSNQKFTFKTDRQVML
jgi:hypothetical protein